MPTIDSLAEISGWLGTFRERLRLARTDEQVERVAVAVVVQPLEAFSSRGGLSSPEKVG